MWPAIQPVSTQMRNENDMNGVNDRCGQSVVVTVFLTGFQRRVYYKQRVETNYFFREKL